MREVDVVHHNMRPGVAERLGVDYETAKRLNPTVIYCHTTMWGNDGPRATWPGFDQLAQSSCGLEQELGGEGNGPNWYRFGMCDQACAVQSALAVLMALYWRERTGEGQLVDTSIVNGGVHLNTDAWIGPDGSWSERPRTDSQQTGSRSALPPLPDERRLARGGLPRADALDRAREAVPALDDRASAIRRARSDADALGGAGLPRVAPRRTPFDLLDGAGVPVELAPEDAAAHVVRRNPTSSPPVSSPTTSTRPTGASASSATSSTCRTRPARIAGPPPLLGQHSREVLPELGYSDRRDRPAARARRHPSGPTDAARHRAGRKR